MTKPVRWGVLGAAKFARQFMAPAIHAARGAEFSALATSDPSKAAAFDFAPGIFVHNDYEALLADPGIDAIYIPLPNHLHVEWTLKALDAGKHVLCEKPLAMTAQEIDDVIAARDRTGLLAAEAYMIAHHPQFHRARQLYNEGAIGSLVRVDCVFSFDNRDQPDNIRNKPDTGGGALADIGVYALGAARLVTGQEPVEITHADLRLQNGVDVYAQVNAVFDSFLYSGCVSMRMAPRQEITFHGEEGIIRLTCPFNSNVFGEARLELTQGDPMRVTTERWPGVNHYVNQVEAFCATVRGEAEYPCPLEFSRGTAAMLDRVRAFGS